jgi:hypothetical protein
MSTVVFTGNVALPALANVPRDAAERASAYLIGRLAANVRRETPRGRRPRKGRRLQNSIVSRIYQTGSVLGYVSIGLDPKYTPIARLVIAGTRPHLLAPVKDKKTKWAHSKRKWGMHPGTAPNPIMERGLAATEAAVAEALSDAGRQALANAIATGRVRL